MRAIFYVCQELQGFWFLVVVARLYEIILCFLLKAKTEVICKRMFEEILSPVVAAFKYDSPSRIRIRTTMHSLYPE